MPMKKVKHFLKEKQHQAKNPENIIDASYFIQLLGRVSGSAMFVWRIREDNVVISRFSPLGLVCTIFWGSIYFACAFFTLYTDETLLRHLYNTKLKQYGEFCERLLATLYGFYCLFKVPLHINRSTVLVQEIVRIDIEFVKLQKSVDYSADGNFAFKVVLVQVIGGALHLGCLWMTKPENMTFSMIALMVHVLFSDAYVLIIMGNYIFYLGVMKQRFSIVNDLMTEIYESELTGSTKSILSREQRMCETINACCKIYRYSLLYRVAGLFNRMFGVALVLTLFSSVVFIILNMFYVMEATAAGIFTKYYTEKSIYFVIFVSYQIVFVVGVVVMMLFFCESTKKKSKALAHITHNVINKDISPRINTLAMQLSQQLLHQVPVFSAGRLMKLEYSLLLQLFRFITTFLVILLRFAMD